MTYRSLVNPIVSYSVMVLPMDDIWVIGHMVVGYSVMVIPWLNVIVGYSVMITQWITYGLWVDMW